MSTRNYTPFPTVRLGTYCMVRTQKDLYEKGLDANGPKQKVLEAEVPNPGFRTFIFKKVSDSKSLF
jgi:hypothetical protein